MCRVSRDFTLLTRVGPASCSLVLDFSHCLRIGSLSVHAPLSHTATHYSRSTRTTVSGYLLFHFSFLCFHIECNFSVINMRNYTYWINKIGLCVPLKTPSNLRSLFGTLFKLIIYILRLCTYTILDEGSGGRNNEISVRSTRGQSTVWRFLYSRLSQTFQTSPYSRVSSVSPVTSSKSSTL